MTSQERIPGGIPLLSGLVVLEDEQGSDDPEGVIVHELGQVQTATGTTLFGTEYCRRLSQIPGAWLPERERRSLNSARGFLG